MLFVVNSGLFYGAQITQNCASISPEKIAKLQFLRNNQPQVMVIDCSHPPREDAPRNHCDLNTVLALNEVIRSPRVILTHISHQFDAWLMENALPSGFEAGFDGMEIGVA